MDAGQSRTDAGEKQGEPSPTNSPQGRGAKQRENILFTER